MSSTINPFASIGELQTGLGTGKVSAIDLTSAFLGRIDQLDPQLHAFVSVFGPWALSTAAIHDRDIENGTKAGQLQGIPVAIKDLFDLVGVPTRAGSKATSFGEASSTAFCVQKLIDAGATILGKTHTVEFAFGGWGTNSVMGTPRNPWDMNTHRVPGGSSSGPAVAVASGMVTAALGTDTGGSVRTPASYCGLVGTKTSSGLVSRHGVFPLCPTHDTVGTLTRTVRDAGRMLEVISGPDSNDSETLVAPTLDFLTSLDDGVDGLKIGILGNAELEAASPEVLRLYSNCLGILSAEGCQISEHILPRKLTGYLEDGGRLMSAESYASLKDLVEPEDSLVAPAIRERVSVGKAISRDEYLAMLTMRNSEQQRFHEGLGECKALVMPTCSNTAIPVGDVDETAIVTPFGRFVNYLDLAAVSVPMGLTREGLPAGLQIVVKKFDDAVALQIAQVIENAIGTFNPENL